MKGYPEECIDIRKFIALLVGNSHGTKVVAGSKTRGMWHEWENADFQGIKYCFLSTNESEKLTYTLNTQ